MELCSLVKLEFIVEHLVEDGGEGRREERKAMFWLVHEALSAQLLREKLEYDARRVPEEQEREREKSKGLLSNPWGHVSYIRCLQWHTGTIQLTWYEVYSRQGQNGLLNNVVLKLDCAANLHFLCLDDCSWIERLFILLPYTHHGLSLYINACSGYNRRPLHEFHFTLEHQCQLIFSMWCNLTLTLV